MGTPVELDMRLEATLQTLETMTLERLRAFWLYTWGDPPELRSVVLLRHLIAWRLQAARYGGLDSAARRILSGKLLACGPTLAPGMKLTREYLGVLHEVEVTRTGYMYAGVNFRSLTRVAKQITGTHRNGPSFFGLRPKS
jgi:hypothetical protein